MTGALAVWAFTSTADAQTARTAPDPIESHRAAGKNAAGGRDNTPDFYGLVTAICVAPLNAPRAAKQDSLRVLRHLRGGEL
jgi:hypothetical protein